MFLLWPHTVKSDYTCAGYLRMFFLAVCVIIIGQLIEKTVLMRCTIIKRDRITISGKSFEIPIDYHIFYDIEIIKLGWIGEKHDGISILYFSFGRIIQVLGISKVSASLSIITLLFFFLFFH